MQVVLLASCAHLALRLGRRQALLPALFDLLLHRLDSANQGNRELQGFSTRETAQGCSTGEVASGIQLQGFSTRETAPGIQKGLSWGCGMGAFAEAATAALSTEQLAASWPMIQHPGDAWAMATQACTRCLGSLHGQGR